MKIAYFTDTFLPQINGVATSIANFSTELGKRGHEVMIFVPQPGTLKDKFRAKNVSVIYLPSLPSFVYPEFRVGILGFPKVLKYLRSFNPDIIHFHTPMTVGMDALVSAKVLKKPL